MKRWAWIASESGKLAADRNGEFAFVREAEDVLNAAAMDFV